jgi:hypothetical protein
MSKLKANRIEPRANNGTLTIGNPDSSTRFEGDVQIPQYATEEWVEGIVTEDIAVELSSYQKKDEKNKANGYAGLDANGHIPAENIPGINDKVSKSGDSMTGELTMLGGAGEQITVRTDNKETAKIWADGTIESTKFKVTGERKYDVEFGESGHLAYNGTNKINWGSAGSSFTVPIAMGDNKITDLGYPTDDTDAATKKYVDASSGGGDYVEKTGDTMTGTLTLDGPRDIDITTGTAGHLLYGGVDKIQWGANVTIQNAKLDLDGNKIVDVGEPTENSDAATKYYVDNASETISHPVEIAVMPAVSNSEPLLTIKNGGTTYFKFMGDRDFEMEGGQIKNLAEPTLDTDAASKIYVDSIGERGIQGPIMIQSDYVGTTEVVFGVYEELTREQALEKGHDLESGIPKAERDGVPYSQYALFRVMGDGKLWAFNSLKGLSAAPGANYDATNKEYVDTQISALTTKMADEYLALEGGTEHKATGDLYMGGHRVTGLTSEFEHASDALSYTAGDARYSRKSTFEALEARIVELEARIGGL